MELIAADDAGAVGAGLLYMDDGRVDLGHRDGHHLLARDQRVLHLNTLQILDLGHGLALLLADAPVLHQAGALHQADRQEGQAQRGGVQHEHQHILGVVLIGQLALLDGSAEATGHVGIAGVGGVAVDVSSHAALADEHVPIAARRSGPDSEVLLALAQDLGHSSVGLAVGGEAADRENIAVLDEFRHGVVQGIYFIHDKTPITKDFLVLLFLSNFQGADMRSLSATILTQLTQEVYL